MVQMKTFNSRAEWLKGRTSQIGGSDAAAVLGLNPWKSNVELWEEKTHRRDSPDISDKPEVVFGNRAESHIRELFALDHPQYEVCYEENNMWINTEYPFAHASLDGWLIEKETGRKGILEIKTTNIVNNISLKKWENRIPDNYFCQILHYFMVTGFDFAILKARLRFGFEDDIYCQVRHYRIDRAEVVNDIVTLEQAEKAFVQNIEHDERPSLILPNI